jgi:hypothetical protein
MGKKVLSLLPRGSEYLAFLEEQLVSITKDADAVTIQAEFPAVLHETELELGEPEALPDRLLQLADRARRVSATLELEEPLTALLGNARKRPNCKEEGHAPEHLHATQPYT